MGVSLILSVDRRIISVIAPRCANGAMLSQMAQRARGLTWRARVCWAFQTRAPFSVWRDWWRNCRRCSVTHSWVRLIPAGNAEYMDSLREAATGLDEIRGYFLLQGACIQARALSATEMAAALRHEVATMAQLAQEPYDV